MTCQHHLFCIERIILNYYINVCIIKRSQRQQAHRKKMKWFLYEFHIKTVCFVTTIRISQKSRIVKKDCKIPLVCVKPLV